MSSYARRPLRAVLLGAAGLFVAGAVAAEPAPAFTDLLTQAQSTAPRLAEARANVARADGLARQARAFSNPTVSVDVENFSGSGPYRGASLSETTASLQQTVEVFGKRSARIAAGRADATAARARGTQAQAEFTFDLAAAYAEAEASDRRLALAQENLSLAGEDARIASALVQAGREADLRRLQAQAAVQAARASVDEAQAARLMAFANLTTLSGSAAPITSIPTSLLDRQTPLFGKFDVSAAASAAYAAAQADREAAARRLTIERLRPAPDPTLSIGVRKFRENDATALVAGVSLPLPLFDRNSGNIAAARADVNAAEARLTAARLEAEAAVRTSVVRIEAAESRLTAARESEKTAAEAYRLARIGYEAGKLQLVELVNARRALADARTQTIAAAVERIGAQAAQARLGGVATAGEQQ